MTVRGSCCSDLRGANLVVPLLSVCRPRYASILCASAKTCYDLRPMIGTSGAKERPSDSMTPKRCKASDRLLLEISSFP